MATRDDMEFEDVYVATEAVDTTKRDEVALVRITKTTNKSKGTESYSMSIGTYVQSDNYEGWGRGAPRFNSPEQIDGLIEELEAMRDEWVAKSYSGSVGRASQGVKIVRKGMKRSAAADSVKPSAPKTTATSKRRVTKRAATA